ncbi:FAD-dependent oxidoreductase [Sphingomonas sp. ac-8]|uniref:FAD-dependent oxidoreductase n=1 Tax=Sphingomonas sp. ac-8 TaxID=3242977 RepID=UPI003A7F70C5
MKADRRTVLALCGVAAAGMGAAGAHAFLAETPPDGVLSGADFGRGHRLRGGTFPAPAREERAGVVIAGGGVAGLAAGWTLADAGFDDFRLLELEDSVGGNARSGRNAVSAFPLGAHYLPVANREAGALRHMLGRFGMIVGEAEGRPVYDPLQLCADLQERLFWKGRWQAGLVPRSGLTRHERDEFARFETEMQGFATLIGSDGKPGFAIPVAYSSADPAIRALDRWAFSEWLDDRGFTSAPLRAHIRYGTRDDYGTEPEQLSAWAGIHYFAGRRGWAAGETDDNLLTWPEGNARLVRHMAAAFPNRIASGRLVHRVARDGDGVLVDAFDIATDETVRFRADAAILAMPLFIAARICPEIGDVSACSHAPWVVANVTVERLPEGAGVPVAWDNVSSTSDSLGYVVATHQSEAITGASVLTWYQPLSRMAPAAGRRLLLERSAEAWKALVRDDLLAMHPELDGAIRSIDVWRWGHAMIRPTPGYIWGAAQRFATPPPLYLAHADLSGLSIFEEAHFHGTRAAEAAMAQLGHRHEART